MNFLKCNSRVVLAILDTLVSLSLYGFFIIIVIMSVHKLQAGKLGVAESEEDTGNSVMFPSFTFCLLRNQDILNMENNKIPSNVSYAENITDFLLSLSYCSVEIKNGRFV
jgi:hypothetical protein